MRIRVSEIDRENKFVTVLIDHYDLIYRCCDSEVELADFFDHSKRSALRNLNEIPKEIVEVGKKKAEEAMDYPKLSSREIFEMSFEEK